MQEFEQKFENSRGILKETRATSVNLLPEITKEECQKEYNDFHKQKQECKDR